MLGLDMFVSVLISLIFVKFSYNSRIFGGNVKLLLNIRLASYAVCNPV